MFFSDERLHFFKPLSGKYREQVSECLGLLYKRQYSSTADYGQSLNRDQLVEILEEALVLSANHVLDSDVGSDDGASEIDSRSQESEQRFKSAREQANWVLKQLLDCGWIERQVDAATMHSTFPFTRMGRVFSQALLESDSTQIRTRHRNTRNTLNALEAFLARAEVYDLIDAYEYSERIITDFTDVISELEERKRELVRQVESHQLVHQATDQFFDFMEKRFQPDISVRLSADSVEKHREEINKVITKIRRKQKAFKQLAEQQLRKAVPDLCAPEHSYLWFILDTIEQRMLNAAEVMLPALRRALHSFTKRADIIIRQLSYLNSQHNSDLLDVCNELRDLDDKDYASRLSKAAEAMSVMKVGLVDPQHIKLQERSKKQEVDSIVREPQKVDQEAQRELIIQQMLDQAFVINNENVRDYVLKTLKAGKRISTKNLPVDSARDLLAMAHIVELGAVSGAAGAMRFNVEATGERVTTSPYYDSYDEFTIELVESTNITR